MIMYKVKIIDEISGEIIVADDIAEAKSITEYKMLSHLFEKGIKSDCYIYDDDTSEYKLILVIKDHKYYSL